MINRR